MESPQKGYPGVYFYARRGYYPKPFKDLVVREVSRQPETSHPQHTNV